MNPITSFISPLLIGRRKNAFDLACGCECGHGCFTDFLVGPGIGLQDRGIYADVERGSAAGGEIR